VQRCDGGESGRRKNGSPTCRRQTAAAMLSVWSRLVIYSPLAHRMVVGTATDACACEQKQRIRKKKENKCSVFFETPPQLRILSMVGGFDVWKCDCRRIGAS
jgi:hypothetical protein